MPKSVMKHQFATVPSANIPRSSFDRSHGYKTTFDAGKLIPVFVDEVLPGDTFNLRMTAFCRLATPLKPIMDNMFMDVHFFFVPYRQIWGNFRKFCGEQANPSDSTDFTVPLMSAPAGGYDNETLADYLGIPTKIAGISHSALPFRAYWHVFNEWYRDQNVQNTVSFSVGDGPDASSQYLVQSRNKRHDYFTSALPWPQKGDPVSLPLGDLAPITKVTGVQGEDVAILVDGQPGQISKLATNQANNLLGWTGQVADDGSPLLYADLSTATATTINAIREAFQIQKLLERDARGGTRYAEIVKSHFGVNFMDVTYRPEYLGGGTSMVNISPIPQSSGTAVDPATGYTQTPQGNLAAMGTVSVSGPGFTKSFTEHGVVLGIASVRADLTYQQGLERFWSRQTRYDFYWPALAHLGEQSILNIEIFAQGNPIDANVFGYQERYAEYRYKPSKITGKFRSNDDQSLDFWHLSQQFSTLPTLSPLFIKEDPPLDRCIAVQDEPHFLMDAYFQLRCARPMPVRAVPGLIDHF